MERNKVLAEAYRLTLEHYAAHELEGVVDYRTGEIFDRLTYPADVYVPDRSPLPPCFLSIRSPNGLGRYLEHVDKRTLILRNDCRRLFDADKGNHHLRGTSILVSPRVYWLMSALVDRLDYRNTILRPTASIAASLRIPRSHLHRALTPLRGLVRIYGTRDGLAKGITQINVNPAFGFRYESHDFSLARRDAIQHWYRSLLQ